LPLGSSAPAAADAAPAAEPTDSPRLDEWLRELVRSEVRAEVARAVATAPAQPTHVSIADYAAARSISISTVRNAIRGGRLPALHIGTAVRVPVDVEIGRPVVANGNGPGPNPVLRAEQILARRSERSAKSSARSVAA
jgi:hypothetical protein